MELEVSYGKDGPKVHFWKCKVTVNLTEQINEENIVADVLARKHPDWHVNPDCILVDTDEQKTQVEKELSLRNSMFSTENIAPTKEVLAKALEVEATESELQLSKSKVMQRLTS